MDKQTEILLDSLIPRGGIPPSGIHVDFEVYLSRLSNLYRKLQGVSYRLDCWNAICYQHLKNFDRIVERSDIPVPTKYQKFKWSRALRDTKVENEFEMFLYSISSALTALTRVVACFLKGSTDFKSHAKLPSALLPYPELNESLSLINNALDSWARELKGRRDAAAHYIALAVESSIENSKLDPPSSTKNIVSIGITKVPVKFVSIWEDLIPTLGGSGKQSFFSEDSGLKKETHTLLDFQNKIIIECKLPLPPKPELIDGAKYVQDLYYHFTDYVNKLLTSLKPRLQKYNS